MSRLTRMALFGAAAGSLAMIGGLAVSGKLPLIKKPVDQAATAKVAKADQQLAAAVSVEIVTTEKFTESLMVTGSLVAREEILVGPEVEGFRIIEVLADEGDRVKKGQILARLVSNTLDAQLAQNEASIAKTNAAIAQAKSNVISAEARATEAKNAFERAKPLRQSGYLSEALLDQREATFKTAQAALAVSRDALKVTEAEKDQVEAQRSELSWRRSRTDVPAPADGIISRRVARVGGFAAGAGDAMFRIIANGEVELDAEIPETRLAKLRPGQTVDVTLDGSNNQLAGKVRLVSPEVDRATRLGRIRIQVEPNPALRIGAFARGTIAVESATGLGVPASAIQHSSSGARVQIVQDGRVVVRPVKLGLTGGARTEIREGLADRDLVIARSGTFLREGDAVRPILPGQAATR